MRDSTVLLRDVVASTELAVGGGARVLTMMFLVVAIVIAARTIRLMWEPIAEFVHMIVRTAVIGALAFVMLVLVMAVSLGVA